MKYIFSTLFVLILAGCTSTATNVTTQQALQNPLFAERYAEEILDRFTTLEINLSPEFEDEAMRAAIEDERTKWRKIAREASSKRADGRYGSFNRVTETDYVVGGVLLHNNTVYLSTDFEAYPSPQLGLYFSTAVDPREIDFPAEGSEKFATIDVPYGMQSFAVSTVPEGLRTVVLYDELLGRIVGFAQL